eukprot:427883_1
MSCLFLVLCFVQWICISQKRPNFLFLLTDDLDYTFDSTSYMPNTLKYIAKAGITFNNAFISTPVCCPSRVETITGRNYQNIGAPNGTCMHITTTPNIFNLTSSFFQKFHDNGYLTGSFGKLTNDQSNFWCNNKPLIDGFDRINCPCQQGNFFGLQYYQKYMNGSAKLVNYTLSTSMYQTSFMANESIKWIENIMNNPNTKDKPFIGWIGIHAPHFAATPATWYQNEFNDKIAPRTPHFNLKVYNHHDFVSTNPILNDTAIEWIDQLYRDRLRSLLSVDDMVLGLVNVLTKYDILDDTYILFTSDHGYHLGQWRISCEKRLPYETDIRIPLFLCGPGVEANTYREMNIGNIDILPTFLDLAGIVYDKNDYDGRSWVGANGQIMNDSNWKRDVYLTQFARGPIEDFSTCRTWWPKNGSFTGVELEPPGHNEFGQSWMNNDPEHNSWRALRILNETANWVYAEYVDQQWNKHAFKNPWFYEFFDIAIDPYEVDNVYASLDDWMKIELHEMVMTYGECKGTNCW